MSRTTILCVVLAVVSLASAGEKYTDKYDNVDVVSVLSNDRLRNVYLNCLLESGAKCPEDAKVLKTHLSEALETDCAKCTDKQVVIVKDIIGYLKKNHAEDYEKLAKLYDPEGKYAAKHPEV